LQNIISYYLKVNYLAFYFNNLIKIIYKTSINYIPYAAQTKDYLLI
jgi:hypothetical protein